MAGKQTVTAAVITPQLLHLLSTRAQYDLQVVAKERGVEWANVAEIRIDKGTVTYTIFLHGEDTRRYLDRDGAVATETRTFKRGKEVFDD